MAGSRVSLFSLGGTYSTALFAMMSTPECLKTVGMGISVARDEALTSWSLLAFVQSALQDIELPGISQELSGATLPVIVAEVMY